MNKLIFLLLFTSCTLTQAVYEFGMYSKTNTLKGEFVLSKDSVKEEKCLHLLLGIIPMGKFQSDMDMITEILEAHSSEQQPLGNITATNKATIAGLWNSVCVDVNATKLVLKK